MDKLPYAVAFFASALLLVAGSYLDADSLRLIGGFSAGAFTVKLVTRV